MDDVTTKKFPIDNDIVIDKAIIGSNVYSRTGEKIGLVKFADDISNWNHAQSKKGFKKNTQEGHS